MARRLGRQDQCVRLFQTCRCIGRGYGMDAFKSHLQQASHGGNAILFVAILIAELSFHACSLVRKARRNCSDYGFSPLRLHLGLIREQVAQMFWTPR